MGPREHSFKDTSHHCAWHHKRGWPPGCIPMGFPPPATYTCCPHPSCRMHTPPGGWGDLQEGFRGEEGHFVLPPIQGTTKPWAQPLLQGTGFPHHQVPQLTPSPTPWPWGECGGCQELGLGCGRSCPAGRHSDGRESRAAFPARVGPSWPPSIPLRLLFPWGSTQQPQNVDPKSSFPSLWGLLAVTRARIHLQEARSGSMGHSVSPPLLPAGGWGGAGSLGALRQRRAFPQAVYTPVPYDNRHAEGWLGMGRSCVCHERRLPAGRRGPAPWMAPRQHSQCHCATRRCPGGTPSCPHSPPGTRPLVGTGRDEPESQQGGGWSPSKPYSKGYMVTQGGSRVCRATSPWCEGTQP